MGSTNVKTATDSGFENDVLKSSVPVLVDFWAEWCGPCRALAPTIDALAGEFAGKVSVFKMNVDENPETPSKYHIRGIPTLLLFKNGQLVDQLVGAHPKDSISKMLTKAL